MSVYLNKLRPFRLQLQNTFTGLSLVAAAAAAAAAVLAVEEWII